VVGDQRNGATVYEYNDADQVRAITTPSPATGQAPLITLVHYNQMLQRTNVVAPDKASAFTEYHLTGEIKKNLRRGNLSGRVHLRLRWAGQNRSHLAECYRPGDGCRDELELRSASGLAER